MKDRFRVGRFTVFRGPVPGVAAERFSVFLRGRMVGASFSRPNADDCERMLAPVVKGIDVKIPKAWTGHGAGRPKKGDKRMEPDDMD